MPSEYLIKPVACDVTSICIDVAAEKLNARGRFISFTAHVYLYIFLKINVSISACLDFTFAVEWIISAFITMCHDLLFQYLTIKRYSEEGDYPISVL